MIGCDLSGKVALITGSRRGIGRATALRLAEAGADIILCDNVVDIEIEANADAVRAMERRARVCHVDVRKNESVEALFRAVSEEFGGIDIVVNAAGVLRLSPALSHTEEDWDLVMDTNLKGMFLMCKAAANNMIEHNKRGTIINFASVDSYNPIPNQISYNCSKAAVPMLTNSLGFEFGKYGIRIVAIAPGVTNTAMMEMYGMTEEDVAGEIGLGRSADPIEQANVVVFLASDLASYVSGTTLRVDGCLCMGSIAAWPEEASTSPNL